MHWATAELAPRQRSARGFAHAWLRPEVSAAASARTILRTLDNIDLRTLADLELVVTELVSNSVRYARFGPNDAIELVAVTTGRTIYAEVSDPGPGYGVPDGSSERAELSGWGLTLVGKLARDWGVDEDGRTRFWVELERRGNRRFGRESPSA